ncbi:MAG: hypothetical protein R2849_14665 [Thermomicrobiales bacterium]
MVERCDLALRPDKFGEIGDEAATPAAGVEDVPPWLDPHRPDDLDIVLALGLEMNIEPGRVGRMLAGGRRAGRS